MEAFPEPSAPTRQRWAGTRQIGSILRSKWPEYCIDIIVIILSITISFTLDSLKEESNQKKSEQVYLKSLLDDIRSDEVELNRITIETRKIIARANSLLLLTDSVSNNSSTFSDNVKNILERPNFISKDATFSDLTSSGNMQLIEDHILKSNLFEYHRLYESIRIIEISERETITTLLAPYLLKYFSVRALTTGKGQAIRHGLTVNQIIKGEDFINVVALRLANREELLNAYDRAPDMTAKIQTIIKSRIKE